jgi:hypothetical protein
MKQMDSAALFPSRALPRSGVEGFISVARKNGHTPKAK